MSHKTFLEDIDIAILCAIFRSHGRKRKGVKHVPEDRIKQLIPQRFHRRFKNALRNLQNLGLVRRVKSRTYALTKYGFLLARDYFRSGQCDCIS